MIHTTSINTLRWELKRDKCYDVINRGTRTRYVCVCFLEFKLNWYVEVFRYLLVLERWINFLFGKQEKFHTVFVAFCVVIPGARLCWWLWRDSFDNSNNSNIHNVLREIQKLRQERTAIEHFRRLRNYLQGFNKTTEFVTTVTGCVTI